MVLVQKGPSPGQTLTIYRVEDGGDWEVSSFLIGSHDEGKEFSSSSFPDPSLERCLFHFVGSRLDSVIGKLAL